MSNGDFSDDSRLYNRDDNDFPRGPMSFAVTRRSPFIMCASEVAGRPADSEFDFRLVAAYGKTAYSCRVNRRRAERFRSSKNTLSEDEWWNVIVWTFLRENIFNDQSIVERYKYPLLFLKATKQDGQFDVFIEHHFDGFTTVLGTLLFREDDVAINVAWWQADCIRERLLQERKLMEKEKELQSTQDQVDLLNRQIQDFIRKKNEDEQALLDKFRLLLNAKKQKIHELGGDADLDDDFDVEGDIKEEIPTPTKGKKKVAATPKQKAKRKRKDDSASEIDEDSPSTPKFRSSTVEAFQKSTLTPNSPWKSSRTQTPTPTPTSPSRPTKTARTRRIKPTVSESEEEIPTESDRQTERTSEDEDDD